MLKLFLMWDSIFLEGTAIEVRRVIWERDLASGKFSCMGGNIFSCNYSLFITTDSAIARLWTTPRDLFLTLNFDKDYVGSTLILRGLMFRSSSLIAVSILLFDHFSLSESIAPLKSRLFNTFEGVFNNYDLVETRLSTRISSPFVRISLIHCCNMLSYMLESLLLAKLYFKVSIYLRSFCFLSLNYFYKSNFTLYTSARDLAEFVARSILLSWFCKILLSF